MAVASLLITLYPPGPQIEVTHGQTAQEKPVANPVTGDAATIQRGRFAVSSQLLAMPWAGRR